MSDNSTVYTKDPNIEQIWAMFRETTKKIQETSNNIEKLQTKYDTILERAAEERRKEIEERRKEDEKRRVEDEKRRVEDEKRRVEDEKRRVEDERRRKEDEESRRLSEEAARKRDRVVKQVSRSLGNLGNRFGELAEHLVAPGIADRFDELGYHFGGVAPHGFLFKIGKRVVAQADVLLENTKTIAIVEIKAKPVMSDIENHVKRMETIRQYYEQLQPQNNKELIGAIAGAIFPEEVKKMTLEAGFYVITQSGDTIKIEVPEGFEPRKF
ncbi:MAG: hypothetical protein LBC20_06250 [Planctomycetaceae bacterium]|jgi:hypothetical protein|nr:hypothetical protein [Planctomycetaceae bacterium]